MSRGGGLKSSSGSAFMPKEGDMVRNGEFDMAVKFEAAKEPRRKSAKVDREAAAPAAKAPAKPAKVALAPAVVSVRFPVEVLEFIDAKVEETGADRAKIVRDIVGRAASRSAKRAAA